MPDKKITLKERDWLICTINPIDTYPNDAMYCVLSTTRPGPNTGMNIKKGESIIINDSGKLEITVLEPDRQGGMSKFLIRKI